MCLVPHLTPAAPQKVDTCCSPLHTPNLDVAAQPQVLLPVASRTALFEMYIPQGEIDCKPPCTLACEICPQPSVITSRQRAAIGAVVAFECNAGILDLGHGDFHTSLHLK